jgi:hypothetical protein
VSYCRFGWDGSDVYIYTSVGGWIECCVCSLQPTRQAELLGEKIEMHESFKAYDTQEMIYHIKEHREKGDHIPDYVEEELIADDKENMKYIQECGNADL